ncbi:unnamed protein product, partial [marine sediment metagenome]
MGLIIIKSNGKDAKTHNVFNSLEVSLLWSLTLNHHVLGSLMLILWEFYGDLGEIMDIS